MRLTDAYREMKLIELSESVEDDMKRINAEVHAKAMKSVLARASKIKKKSKAELEAWLEKNKGRAATPNLDKHYPAFAKEVELYKAALAAQPKTESVAEDVSTALEALNESDGYIESMYIDSELDGIVKAWTKWKKGPMTEPGDVAPAKNEILAYLKRNLK